MYSEARPIYELLGADESVRFLHVTFLCLLIDVTCVRRPLVCTS